MKTKNHLLILLVATLFGISACQSQQSITNQYGKENLNGHIDNEGDSLLRNNEEIKSFSVGVIKNGKIYKLNKGKLINGKSPNDHTLYEIASLTKTFTGTLLAKAILDNKIGIDDDIRKYLPKTYSNLEYEGHPISFKNLVTHTSGLPIMFPNHPKIFENPNWDELPFEIKKMQTGYTEKEFLEELHKVKLDTIPGSKFSYSNAGANLIGIILERIYEKPYKDLVKSFVLEPLKMKHTFVGISNENNKILAKGLNANGIEMPTNAQKEISADGGIISTLDDMIKYMRFEMDTANPLIQISHQELFDGKYGNFENGFFWQIFKNEDKTTKIFQNGGAFGTSSWMTIIPEKQIGVFIVTNVSGPEVHRKLDEFADKIIKRAPE